MRTKINHDHGNGPRRGCGDGGRVPLPVTQQRPPRRTGPTGPVATRGRTSGRDQGRSRRAGAAHQDPARQGRGGMPGRGHAWTPAHQDPARQGRGGMPGRRHARTRTPGPARQDPARQDPAHQDPARMPGRGGRQDPGACQDRGRRTRSRTGGRGRQYRAGAGGAGTGERADELTRVDRSPAAGQVITGASIEAGDSRRRSCCRTRCPRSPS